MKKPLLAKPPRAKSVLAALATLAVAGICFDSAPAHAQLKTLDPPRKALAPKPVPPPVATTPPPVATTPPPVATTPPPVATTPPPVATTPPPAAAGTAGAPATAPAPSGSAAAPKAPGLSKFDATKLGSLDARLDAMRQRVEERQKTLDARRQAERDRLRIRWGAVVQQPAVVQALQIHAYRVARLERIQELAQVEAKPAVAARASKALDRENVRHERTMAALASGAAAPPIPPQAGGAK
jgi:hypothetical protein